MGDRLLGERQPLGCEARFEANGVNIASFGALGFADLVSEQSRPVSSSASLIAIIACPSLPVVPKG